MVTRRNVLKGGLAAAFAPALPRLSFDEALTAIPETMPVISETVGTYLRWVVGRYFYTKVDPYRHQDQILLHVRSKRPNAVWHVGHLLSMTNNLLTMTMGNGWSGYFSGEQINDLIKEKLAEQRSGLDHVKDPARGITADSFRIFSDRTSPLAQVHAEIDETLYAIYGTSHPTVPDFITRENFSLEYGHGDRFGALTTAFYRMKIIREDHYETPYSRNDLHFLIEFEFKRLWGTRSGLLELSPEHEKIFSLIESHELSRMHQLQMSYPSADEKKAPQKQLTEAIKSLDITIPEFSNEERERLEQLETLLDETTIDPSDESWFKRAHFIPLSLDEIEKTAGRPMEFAHIVTDRVHASINRDLDTYPKSHKEEILKRWQSAGFSTLQFARAIGSLPSMILSPNQAPSEVEIIPTSEPLAITVSNDLEPVVVDTPRNREKISADFDITLG